MGMASFTKDDETTFLRDMTQLVYEKVDAAAAWRLAMKSFHGDLHLVPVHAASNHNTTTQPTDDRLNSINQTSCTGKVLFSWGLSEQLKGKGPVTYNNQVLKHTQSYLARQKTANAKNEHKKCLNSPRLMVCFQKKFSWLDAT